MSELFGRSSTAEDNSEQWMSVSDLMAGLMMVFLFISIALMREAMLERDKIKEVAETYQANQQSIYEALNQEFQQDLKAWGAEIRRSDLSFIFNKPEVLFALGKDELTPEFERIMDDFFPRYLNVMKTYRHSIQEIRIEGHTSSKWNQNSSDSEAYFNNMRLSQSRTRSVLEYGIHIPQVNQTDYQWVKSNVVAVGYSSSKLVYLPNGAEHASASRRVTFRVLTNAEDEIRKNFGVIIDEIRDQSFSPKGSNRFNEARKLGRI